jgi:hypothetical protein
MRNSTSSRSAKAFILIAIALTGCHKQPVKLSTASPIRSHIDLQHGWRLTVISPLSALATQTQSTGPGLDITLVLDPKVQFGFERTHYLVQPTGLTWQSTTRTIDGKESPATFPQLNLFPKPGRKTMMRLLFLTRASDQNYNTALLTAPDTLALDRFTASVRANPEQVCKAGGRQSCLWIPPGVAARPEKPGPRGEFVPVL